MDKLTLSKAGAPRRGNVPGATAKVIVEPETAPLYEVVAQSGFFHGKLWRKGERVRYSGKPGAALMLVDEAKPVKAAPKPKADSGGSPTDKDVL